MTDPTPRRTGASARHRAPAAGSQVPSTTSRPVSRQLIGLLGWLSLVFATAAVGAIASVDAQSFYARLIKPAWAPAAAVFGPVWSVLYLLMGISAWLVWRSPRRGRGAFVLFFAQLAANALWSWLFFAWHQGALAAVEVLVLLGLIAATMRAFRQSSRLAAILLLPYLLWVAFASALAWSAWLGNPGLL
jgi:benzodiazapine receptor